MINFGKILGGKTSYAEIQDSYNKFITEKGYNLFRGNIGNNKHYKTKVQKEIEELKATKEISEINSNAVLNPVKKLLVIKMKILTT